jgi:hypothetical protein
MKHAIGLVALAMLAPACGAAPEDAEQIDEALIGQAQQSWTMYYPTSGRMFGTQGTGFSNAQCSVGQSSSKNCYFVPPSTDYLGLTTRYYKVFIPSIADLGTYGSIMHAELDAAIDNLEDDWTLYAGTADERPGVVFIKNPTASGSQCRIVGNIDLPAPVPPSSTNLNHFVQTVFFSTNAVSEVGAGYAGTWYRSGYAEIRLDQGAMAFISGVSHNEAARQAITSGLLQCIGIGRQGTDNTSYTFNNIQPTVYNNGNRWGNCAQKWALFAGGPQADGGITSVSFSQFTGSCTLP